MELKRHLTASNLNDFLDNVRNVLFAMRVSGKYSGVDDIAVPEKITPFYYPKSMLNLFNTIEKNLADTDKISDWVNPYLGQHNFQASDGVLYPYVKRWFDWTDFNLKIVNNEIEKPQYLKTIESESEEQIYDIEGQPILSLEGYFS